MTNIESAESCDQDKHQQGGLASVSWTPQYNKLKRGLSFAGTEHKLIGATMHTIQNFLLVSLLLVAIPGCMTPGQQLETVAISQLHEGQTQEEVRQIFGKPAESVSGGNGNRLEVFRFASPKSMSEGGFRTVEVRTLHVLYSASGQVQKFTSSVGEVKGHVGRNRDWKAGRPFDPEKLNNIQRRLTTHDELIETFGPAVIEGLDVQGNRVGRWFFSEGNALKEARRRELYVIFDANLVVRDFLLHDLRD